MKKVSYWVAIGILALSLLIPPPVEAGISSPNMVPDFDNYSTPVITPGDVGILSFTIMNRYNVTMTNVSLTLEIYEYATFYGAEYIGNISNAPVTESANFVQIISNKTIYPSSNMSVSFKIYTQPTTPEGVYFVRSKIEFVYAGINKTQCLMKSRGYFDNILWEAALDIPDNVNRSNETQMLQYPGGMNISVLGVDGIITDTSFSVKTTVQLWPPTAMLKTAPLLVILIGITAFFGVLTIIFYWQDSRVPKKQKKKLRKL